MGLLDLVLGKCDAAVPKKNAAKLLNVCMKNDVEYLDPRFDEACFIISCHADSVKKLKSACTKRGLELKIENRKGLPYALSKYKTRVGLLVGAVLSAVLVVYALNVVWRIDTFGNERISSGELEELLGDSGFSVGSFVPAADLTLIENRVMQQNPDVAWISINMNGTVANVEIRETRRGAVSEKNTADLVAATDGKIERIEVYNGNCVVRVGDVVRAGEVLVSGIYQNDKGEFRESRAEGEVYARTVKDFFVEIPFENTKKVYTGRKFSEIYINFFKKSIKLFANTGKMPPTCDIIYKNGELGLSHFPKIPIGYKKTEYSEYCDEAVTLSEEEAMERAFALLDSELRKMSDNIELLSKNVDFEITDEAYILKCRLVCIENIAIVRDRLPIKTHAR